MEDSRGGGNRRRFWKTQKIGVDNCFLFRYDNMSNEDAEEGAYP